jgi:glycosyltransferase involved in cell wall biosynthesis
MYAAQNIDKRLPPPFAQFERSAYRRVAALYPCSKQAASVSRGKGYEGLIEVLPLGFDSSVFVPGSQSVGAGETILGFIGRLVPEKGLMDAVEVLARCNRSHPARLLVVGDGPEGRRAAARAATLGISDRIDLVGSKAGDDLASIYRQCHIVLVPSKPTSTWVEQFGRVIVEAQASGAVVAGYATGSIPEVAGESAVLVCAGNAIGLADAVTQVALDPVGFEKRRRGGFAASTERTWESVAARQAEVYRCAVAKPLTRLDLPRSPARRRAIANAEFGSTARTVAGDRPFALPGLRRGPGIVPSTLAAVIDSASELSARLRGG